MIESICELMTHACMGLDPVHSLTHRKHACSKYLEKGIIPSMTLLRT